VTRTPRLGRASLGALLVALSASAVVLVVWLVTRMQDIPFRSVAADPLVVADGPVYAGVLSNMGVLVWWTGASAAAILAPLLWREGDRRAGRAVLALGAVTVVLAVDDLFLLHEQFGPNVLGVAQDTILAGYALGVVIVLVALRRFIAASAWPVLAVALVAFSTSVVADVLAEEETGLHSVIEDGAKFVGIAAWTVFLVHAGWCRLRPADPPVAPTPGQAR